MVLTDSGTEHLLPLDQKANRRSTEVRTRTTAEIPEEATISKPDVLKGHDEEEGHWRTVNGTAMLISGDGDIEAGPDGIDNLGKDQDITQHPDIFHNIKTDPTKDDRADLVRYAKDIATLKFRKDSLTRQVIEKLTTDPTRDDRKDFVRMVGGVLTLKPVRDLVTGRSIGPNPAMDDVKIITAGVRKAVDSTVGSLFRLVGNQIRESRATGPDIPDNIQSRVMTGPSPGILRAMDLDPRRDDIPTVEETVDEIMRRVGNDMTVQRVQDAILDVIEELLQHGRFEQQHAGDQNTSKAAGLTGTTGESGGFVQRPARIVSPKDVASDDDWFEKTMALADRFDELYGDSQ